MEERSIGSEPKRLYGTAPSAVNYLRPTPIEAVVHLSAQVATVEDRFTVVECSLQAEGKVAGSHDTRRSSAGRVATWACDRVRGPAESGDAESGDAHRGC
jgi:hypothetical protein